MSDIVRTKSKPRFYDINYFVAKSNLEGIKKIASYSNKKSKVLDLGCGMKPFKTWFKYAEYLGIDYTKDNTDADVVLDLNKDKIPYKDNSFDIVIVSDVLEHIYNIEHFIKEAKRVLKKGGHIFFSTPFMYPIHEKKYDYYRYTKNFYEEKFKEMKCVYNKQSNYSLATPFILINQLFYFSSIFVIVHLLNNILVVFLEVFARLLYRFKRFKFLLDYAPVEYYYIFKKQK